MKNTLLIIASAITAFSLCGVAFAQGPPPMQAPPGPPLALNRDLFFFMSARWRVANVVKGAPYSARAITETVQKLADGNRIDRKETSAVYRDAQGRVRIENTLRMIGPWRPDGRPIERVIIDDPVAHLSYILNPRTKKAQKILEVRGHRLRSHAEGGERVQHRNTLPTSTQSLGTRTIEGLKVEGERRTVTIPAGEIGNEKPIKIVSESWYSPKLKVYVLTRRDDPRFGDTTYRLTDVKLGPQPESLFQPPADYAIEITHQRRIFRMGPPPQPPEGSGH